MSAQKIRYIIADDHKLFREGLALVLSDDPMLQLSGEAKDGAELLELLRFEQPDVILLDLSMPNMDGREALKSIKGSYPEVKILILTMSDDQQIVLDLIEGGANGYLLKNADSKEIKLALRACVENGYYFNDFVSGLLVRSLVQKKKADPSFKAQVSLNDREREVLQLICEGLTNAEIGRQIFLSPRTVEGIRASLLEKTGTRNTAGLVMYAAKNGIVV